MSLWSSVKLITESDVDVYQWDHSLDDVLYVTLSWPGGLAHANSKPLIAAWRSMMFKATQHHSKEAIWQNIEQFGAQVSLSYDHERNLLHLSCVRQFFSAVWSTVFSCLAEASFPEDEWVSVQKRLISKRISDRENVDVLAYEALSRLIYPAQHLSCSATVEMDVAAWQKMTHHDLAQYHTSQLTCQGIRVFIAGSLDRSQIKRMLQDLKTLPKKSPMRYHHLNGIDVVKSTTQQCSVVQKNTVSVMWGHILNLRYDDLDYAPLVIANHALGGNFTAHLMQIIRDQKGLTYNIYAAMMGLDYGYPGMWFIKSSFSPDRRLEGIEATEAELAVWLNLITSEIIESKKTGWLGAKHVSLASVSKIVNSLQWSVDQGLGVDFYDRFMDQIQEVTLTDVKRVVSKYFKVASLNRVESGAIK